MVFVTIVSIVTALGLFIRLFFLKREMKRAAKQLQQHGSNRMLDIAFYERDFERLASEINKQIDATKQARAEQKRTENELKQAIANISHDIRTPMTSILGYIQFLESDHLSLEQRDEYTLIVKNSALRLKVLLEDFFELSLIEAADYPLKMETIKLNQLLFEVLAGFYELFHQKGIEPSIHVPTEEIIMTADVSVVKRVMENLIINAIKHSNGDVAIHLEKHPSTIQLIIRNPAPQLVEKDIALLFDRFYKADQTRTGKGTGLGLSIAKSLMGKMKGTLTAELQAGELVMVCEWTRSE